MMDSASAPSRRNSTRKRQRETDGAVSPPPLGSSKPRLGIIPGKIEDLVKVIDMGGCPRCGGCSGCERTKAKVRQTFKCKECGKIFHESKDDSRELTYVNRTFEGKQRLQALFGFAYDQIGKKNLEADTSAFRLKMTSLRSQLMMKRRNISRLLGIPLEDDYENSRTVGGSHESNGLSQVNPFREMILLLRRETPKLEQAVDRLIMKYHSPASLPVPIKELKKVQVSNTNLLLTHQKVLAEGEVDILTVHSSTSDCHESYQLASRIVQDDEEIEIFEKCTGGDPSR